MENNKIHIEELIREIDAEKRKGPKLDADKIIRQANLEIERRELQKKRKRTGYIATASILVVVICVSFTYLSLSTGGYADNFRQMFFRDSTENQERSDNIIDGERKENLTQKSMTLEEIKEASNININMPQHLPEGYEFYSDSTNVIYAYDDIFEINFYFNNYENEKKIEYTIIPTKNRNTRVNLIDKDRTGLIKKTENDITYTYSDIIDEENIIYWEIGEIYYLIIGNENSEELLNMALSIDLED